MSQRNPLNERYTDDTHQGKTRKSAASAKPTSKAASSVHETAAMSKKEKKAEQEARERKSRERRGVSGSNVSEAELRALPEYKKLRRWWWVCLIAAIALTAFTWVYSAMTGSEQVSLIPLIAAWVFIIIAFYIDFWKIRKLRNQLRYAGADKSKAARAQQKQHAAELREKRKQEALNPPEKKPTLGERISGFFGGSKKKATETAKAADETAKAATEAAEAEVKK